MRTQIRVAGILVVGGAVILENLIGTDLWTLPGGRLEDIETLEIGVRREFQKEMGLAVACEQMLIVNENFFPLGGDVMREYGFYFRVRALDPGLSAATELKSGDPRFRYEWTPIERLHELHFQPVALIQHLIDPPASLLYLSTRDASLIG